jgi:hypothetical protein
MIRRQHMNCHEAGNLRDPLIISWFAGALVLCIGAPAAAQISVGIGPAFGGPSPRASPSTEDQIGLRVLRGPSGQSAIGFEYGSMRGRYVLSPVRLTARLEEPRVLTAAFGIRFLVPIAEQWGGDWLVVPDLFGGVAFADNVRTNPGFTSHVGLGGAWRSPRWLLGLAMEHTLFAMDPVTGLGRTLPDGDWSLVASASFRLLPDKEPTP